MSASDLFKAGKLDDAVAAQLQEVKAHPGDHARRISLFELVAFAGDLERARRQIEAVTYDDLEVDAAVQSYRKLIDAETTRRRVFRDGVMPQFLTAPPEWLGIRLQAIQALRNNNPAEAAKVLAEADAATPPVKALLNSKPAPELRDADDLFGPVLEVMAHGDYYWLPLHQVEALAANPPKFPRDLLWLPAKLEVRDGPRGDVFLPALYPFSHESNDIQVKLGRATDWKDLPGGPTLGVGVRVLLAGEDAVPLPELRELQVV